VLIRLGVYLTTREVRLTDIALCDAMGGQLIVAARERYSAPLINFIQSGAQRQKRDTQTKKGRLVGGLSCVSG